MASEESKEGTDAITAKETIEKDPASIFNVPKNSLNGDKDGGSKNDLNIESKSNTPKIFKAVTEEKSASSIAISDENDNESVTNDKVADSVSENTSEGQDFKVEVKEEVIESESDNKSMDSTKEDYNSNHNLELNKEELGKGRRARVPNKRYSDILSPRLVVEMPPTKIRKIAVNGETQANDIVDQTHSETPINRKKKNIDMKDPKFLKPLNCGWKRELVFRAQSEYGVKRAGDIYYYSPKGKKVRSMRELSECLDDTRLSLDDFTFYKESLGIDDPEREIIRDAKHRSANFENSGSSKKKTKNKKHSLPIISSKAKPSPKVGFKVKWLPSGKSKSGGKKAKNYEEDDDGAEWETAPVPIRKDMGSLGTKPCQPCSIQCPGALGMIPTLQCRLCLCLYHNQCMGIAPTVNIAAYVCKNCLLFDDSHMISKQSIAPQAAQPHPIPKLVLPKATSTAITLSSAALHSHSESTPINNSPSTPNKTLQTDPQSLFHLQSKQNPSFDVNATSANNNWLATKATSRLCANQSQAPGRPQRPQFVEFIGDRKFIVIPRNEKITGPPSSLEAERVMEQIASAAEVVESADKPVAASLGPINNTSPITSNRGNSIGCYDETVKDICDNEAHPLTENNRSSTPLQGIADDSTLNDSAIAMEVDPIDDSHNELSMDEGKFKNSRTSSQVVEPPISPSSSPSFRDNRDEEKHFMQSYLQNLSYGYNTLISVFQHLKVQDLLRAGCVCTMWRDLASHPRLWKTVRMKNSQVHSFEGLTNALARHGTQQLDLRKMLLPNQDQAQWDSFSEAIKKVDTLRKIEFCRCPAIVVERIAESNRALEILNATTIKDEKLNLSAFGNLLNLKELRIKSPTALTLTSDLSSLKELRKLRVLSLTSIKELHSFNIAILGELTSLEQLDIGDCVDLPRNFGSEILVKLVNLEKLRLEKGQGECHTFEMLTAVKDMPKLLQLELVNFDIKAGCDKILGACTNLKKLLIIPTYISQSATTNHMVLGGVIRLRDTLSQFIWGVTLELLRVTELFVVQCDEDTNTKDKKKIVNVTDSIPVLKPVPVYGQISDAPLITDPPGVEILSLQNLQKLLLQNLPKTKVKILKIPFHATWRQSITDSTI